MPSQLHEALLLLFRNRPELAPELLRDALGVELPAYSEVRVESADLTEVVPAEYRADLIVLLVDGKPVLAIVVEVQLSRDERKRFTWPVYAVGVRARFECPALVLVIAPSADVARWAALPIQIGPGGTLQPLVLASDAIPIVVDADAARKDPELAVLSVMAHGQGDVDQAVLIALAASQAAHELTEDRWLLYFGFIRVALSEAARKAFQMLPQGQQFFDESQQRSFEKGSREGEARAVLRVLERRGIMLSDIQRQRILECTDRDSLDRWLDRALTVASADELFV